MDYQQETMAKIKAEQEYQAIPRAGHGGISGGLASSLDQCSTKAVQPHPREFLLSDINDQEQKLLDKLAALRGMREVIQFSTLAEAELLMKVSRLADRLRY